MIRLRGCRRCGGSQYREDDDWKCLNCGRSDADSQKTERIREGYRHRTGDSKGIGDRS